jgi:hypothetical protein
MLQNIMQKTGRVVARDPSLKAGRILAIIALAILPTVALLCVASPTLNLLEPLSLFTGISAAYLITYIVQFSQWRKLEKKRQQAALYNFTSQQPAPISPSFASLPARLVIGMQRHWFITYIVGAICGIFILFINVTFYSLWQTYAQQIIQQGQSLGWLFFGTVLYLGFLALCDISLLIAFLSAPRQQLIATQDGLICRLGYRFSYIPWHEARLFAVIGQVRDALVYELSSDTQIIRWVSKPVAGSGYTTPARVLGLTNPFGMVQAYPSKEEYEQYMQTLFAMIIVRSRQPCHDLR